jgi:protein-S-isoprenylcysteine O-methyltransferase Ste14
MVSLHSRAWLSLAVLAVVMGLLLFGSAGTLRYWQAWVYLVLFFACAALTTIDVIRRDPALLERRMSGGPTAEQRPVQKVIQVFTALGFVGLHVVPALDYRYGWSAVPTVAVLAGDVLIAIGFYFIVLVYKENTFASATIEIAAGQKVISTGPYAFVRHPMYASAVPLLLGIPLALGSYWGLLPFAATIPFLLWRILDEERLLAGQLPGYAEYQRKVRFRLLPRIW